MEGLTFEDAEHIYRLDGTVIPSVSAILEPLSKVKYEGIATKTLNKAAAKGTEVHNSIENWLKFGIEDISPERKPFFDAFQDWWGKHDIQIVGSEVKIFHKILLYGGTADLLAYIDGTLSLVDYKTTYSISNMTCAPQLEAYVQALASHSVSVERKLILHLKKDGSYQERDYPVKDIKAWKAFCALKTVYDYIKSC